MVGALVSVTAFRIATGGPLNAEVSPWNAIFASRLMLLAARVAVLAFIAYAMASMLASVRRGQWLTRVGPVEVAASSQRLGASHEAASATARWLAEENQRLDREVTELRRVLDGVDSEIP